MIILEFLYNVTVPVLIIGLFFWLCYFIFADYFRFLKDSIDELEKENKKGDVK